MDLIVTTPDVPLWAWIVAWMSYGASLAPPGHQCVGSTDEPVTANVVGPDEHEVASHATIATVTATVRNRGIAGDHMRWMRPHPLHSSLCVTNGASRIAEV